CFIPFPDVDECQLNPSICGPNSNCINVDGSYNCSCLKGFNATFPNLKISINNTCTDVDECQLYPSVCGSNSNCTNVNGSYSCSCLDGFNAPYLNISINNTCTDVDECQLNPSVCGPNSTCTNVNGHYNCSCLDGFNATLLYLPISINNTCTDVDECQLNPSVCGPNSNCTNVNGSYSCSCLNGFNATLPYLPVSINNTCTDVDECQLNPSVCGPNSKCTNVNGGYNCLCLKGFNATFPHLKISINNTCTDVDECKLYPPVCGPNSNCTNVNGSYNCSCLDGFTATLPYLPISINNTCTDVNECQLIPSVCGPNSTCTNIDQSYKTVPDYIRGSAKVNNFRSGSIIVDYTIAATSSSPDFTSANTQLANSLKLAGLPVDPNSFAESGRYSCIIKRNPMPYIQWQDVVIEQRPKIEVDADRVFECKDQTVPIKCCAALYSIEWDRIPDGDQLENLETNCIILHHKLLKINCGSVETFTCQLKDLKELQGYSYSRKSVTIKTSDKRIDCTSETLGIGQIGDKVNGPCEKGRIGFITYQCQLGGWREIQIECVLLILDTLQSEVQVLTEEKIPGFMANLSNAAVQNRIEISQSASDVKAIVDMLLQITYISPNMTIDKTVMNTYLKTVDVIVSDQTNNTWAELNNGNTTSNTSTALLFAIEVTSNRLSDVNFALNESSIQLERTLIRNSFNLTSQQPNSTTQIMFSYVPEPTFVTLIVFSNLDNVLPTRNDTGTFENRINGDVVVIKVNQTVNNISLTFDITNELLGNPQCVFWNFNLDRWDSNGCKVKHSENGKVTCECNHTTSFSILMSPFFMDDKALSYITYIGVAISMASLVLCLIIEIIVWKSVTGNDTAYMRHVSVVNISVSLLIADICFIIGAAIAKPGESTPVNPCSAAVFFIHFFYLALFFWMLTSALLLLYRTAMVFSQMSRPKMMVIAFMVGYCAPLLIAVITVASTAGAGRYIWTRDVCWLNWSESKALLAFVIPALTIVAFNLLVLIVVLFKIVRRNVNAATQTDEKHNLVVIFRCLAFLTPIFGLTWGFGVGTMVSNVYGLHVVFAILNSFQGFFVLVFGTLLDSKVRQSLAGKLKLNLSSDRTRSTTSTGPSSSVKLGFFGRMRRKHVYHVSDPNHFSRPSSNKTGVSSS
ncbi:adhesion G protein-coupled receptor F4, partial [Misgurnus anguillicaudatus]|uniref:adhesion G protein-coupled receptor F4 n=1 Tax=Misgurnus anguillicaudatus TaxID=75329 RepID=UPI003CCFA29A